MYIDELSEEIEICASCPLMCKNVCCFHLHEKTESSAPHIRNLNLLKVLNEKKDSNEQLAMEQLEESNEKLYKCTLCGQCTAWCGKDRDIPNNMMAGRADLIDEGFVPEEVDEIRRRTEEEHNPLGEPHEERYDKLDKKLINNLSQKDEAKVGFWLGCVTAYRQPEMFEAIVKIMDSAGIDFQILGDEEYCCGLPQQKMGFRKVAKELAEHNMREIKDRGFDTLLVDCPECYRAFKEFYPDWGYSLDVDIVHTSEYIWNLIDEGEISLNGEVSKTITYHDPCELARHTTPSVRTDYDTSDIHQEPRKILKSVPGIKLKEMRWNRLKTFCCGGGEGVREVYPETSEKIGSRVIGEAQKTGAEILVAACPSCKRQFSEIQSEDKEIEILSVPEIVADSL